MVKVLRRDRVQRRSWIEERPEGGCAIRFDPPIRFRARRWHGECGTCFDVREVWFNPDVQDLVPDPGGDPCPRCNPNGTRTWGDRPPTPWKKAR